jgi:hypothetical protein
MGVVVRKAFEGLFRQGRFPFSSRDNLTRSPEHWGGPWDFSSTETTEELNMKYALIFATVATLATPALAEDGVGVGVGVGPVGAGVTVGQTRDHDRDRDRTTVIKEREPSDRTTVIKKEHEEEPRSKTIIKERE